MVELGNLRRAVVHNRPKGSILCTVFKWKVLSTRRSANSRRSRVALESVIGSIGTVGGKPVKTKTQQKITPSYSSHGLRVIPSSSKRNPRRSELVQQPTVPSKGRRERDTSNNKSTTRWKLASTRPKHKTKPKRGK